MVAIWPLGIPLSNLELHCQGLSISLLTLCQTAWAFSLSLLLGTPDVCFATSTVGGW